MDMFGLSIVHLAENKLSYLSERQKVIATNIANVNTPDYVAQDVEEPDFAAMVAESTANKQLAMVTTNPKHINALPSSDTRFKIYTPKPDTALTIDGNGVDLESQLNEASKIKSEHERVLTLYNKYKALLQTANTKISS